MTTIAQFSKPEDAHLLRLRLAAGGITAYVQDENVVQVDWMLSNAVGGVRVEVADEDAEQANIILYEDPVELSDDHPVCPRCSSVKTALDDTPRRLNFLTILLLGIPLLFVKKNRWRCAECGYLWKENSGSSC